MKTLAIIVVIAAIVFLAIGIWIVIVNEGLGLLTPNGLLRLANTSLLFTITILLFIVVFKKKE